MGAYPATTCCGAKCGIPTIVSIGDDHHRMQDPSGAGKDGSGSGYSTSYHVPDWLVTLAPTLAGEEALQAADAWIRCREELRRRSRAFLAKAAVGAPCRLVDQRRGTFRMARYTVSADLDMLEVQEDPVDLEDEAVCQACPLSEVRNIWVCSDSELARRARGSVQKSLLNSGSADEFSEHLMMIDAFSGTMCIVEQSSEAQEEFLDCMSVLISMQRTRMKVDSRGHGGPGGPPPPEVQLRPIGRSLQSVHLAGPIGLWLAEVGESLASLAPANDGDEGDEDVDAAQRNPQEPLEGV